MRNGLKPPVEILKAYFPTDGADFHQAEFCFKKAGDDRGLMTARAFLCEQKARSSKAQGNFDSFVTESEEAIELFLHLQLINNVSKCLENLGEFGRAAGMCQWTMRVLELFSCEVIALWYDQKNYKKAAELFQSARLFERASDSYHLNQNYDKAAELLHLGSLYDELIKYLSQYLTHRQKRFVPKLTMLIRNNHLIEPESRRRYGRICSLLLKQGRVSPSLKGQCIGLLGSEEVKEQCYKEFAMTGHLADLYRGQGRYVDLYQLLVEDGQLESALDLVASKSLYESISQCKIETVFNFLHAERMLQDIHHETRLHPLPDQWNGNLPNYLLSLSIAWDTALGFITSIEKGEASQTFQGLHLTIVEKYLCLYVSKLSLA